METFLIALVILFILAQAENSKKRLPEKYRNLNASKKEAAP